MKPSLCDYSDAFILATWDITVIAGNDTDVAFKNCASFSTCKTEINDVFIEEANHIYIAIPMYIGLKTAFYQVLETLEKQTLIDRHNRR